MTAFVYASASQRTIFPQCGGNTVQLQGHMTRFIMSGTCVMSWIPPAFLMATGKMKFSLLPLIPLLPLYLRHRLNLHHGPVSCRTSIDTSVIMRLHPHRSSIMALSILFQRYISVSDSNSQHRPLRPEVDQPCLNLGSTRRSGFTYADSSAM